MDVPFISSGAISRAHYAIVRKVESAASIQAANQALLAEVQSIRRKLDHTVTQKKCKEYLIILLYCHMTVASGFLVQGTFDFALTNAMNMADAASTIEDKRIGYLFCNEIMQQDHPLQLMLVNTLRKDLESSNVSRICLALDMLVATANRDVIPAVQSRLEDLLSHSYPHIRRRALLAFRSLSKHEPELLIRITRKVLKRVNDSHRSVSSAALIVISEIPDKDPHMASIRETVNELFRTSALTGVKKDVWFLLRILQSLRELGLAEANIPLALDLIRTFSANQKNTAILLGIYRLLSKVEPTLLLSSKTSCIGFIRDFLTSKNPNDQYFFLSCLECINPIVWAGIEPAHPAVLEAWEVEHMMQLLDSGDSLMRKKTLKILEKVDASIIESHYSQILQSIPQGLTLAGLNEYALRLLEVAEIKCLSDSEQYARDLKAIFEQIESVMPDGNKPALEGAVENILTHLRSSDESFHTGCATALLTILTESEMPFGTTMMVILSALAAEYCSVISIPPSVLLRAFSSRLKECGIIAQDPWILAMLRVAKDCEYIPDDALASIKRLREVSSRHIRRCCDQFIALVRQPQVLSNIVLDARSSSLPDFAEALRQYNFKQSSSLKAPSETSLPSPSIPSSPRLSQPTSRLRYNAYDAPLAVPTLRGKQGSSSQRSGGSTKKEEKSDDGTEDLLSRTMTAGELALAAGSQEFETTAKTIPGKVIDDMSSRPDLITLESPFISEHPDELIDMFDSQDQDFEKIWNSLEESSSARGWYGETIDSLVRSLQGVEGYQLQVIPADVEPFMGELKIVVSLRETKAVLRVRESESDGCLWRLRCRSAGLLVQIKRALKEESS